MGLAPDMARLLWLGHVIISTLFDGIIEPSNPSNSRNGWMSLFDGILCYFKRPNWGTNFLIVLLGAEKSRSSMIGGGQKKEAKSIQRRRDRDEFFWCFLSATLLLSSNLPHINKVLAKGVIMRGCRRMHLYVLKMVKRCDPMLEEAFPTLKETHTEPLGFLIEQSS